MCSFLPTCLLLRVLQEVEREDGQNDGFYKGFEYHEPEGHRLYRIEDKRIKEGRGEKRREK